MTIKFTARNIHAEKTERHVLVGFADGVDNVHEFIVVMRILQENSEIPDEVVGKPYFEYVDEEKSGYGCIEQVTLRADRVIFKTDTASCPQIPDREFVVMLALDDERIAKMTGLLTEALGDDKLLKVVKTPMANGADTATGSDNT